MCLVKIHLFMGVNSVCQFPMSSSYIELSSDDEEVQIIQETFEAKKSINNAVKSPRRPSCNAVEKLVRNSSIELTINLEESNVQKKQHANSTPTLGNGIIQHNHNVQNKSQEAEEKKLSNGCKSDSDVEIIDDERPANGTYKSSINPSSLPTSQPSLTPRPRKSVGQVALKSTGQVPVKSPGEVPTKSLGQIALKSTGQVPIKSPGQLPTKSSSQVALKSTGQVPLKYAGQVPLKSAGQVARKSLGQVALKSTSQAPRASLSQTNSNKHGRHSMPQMVGPSFAFSAFNKKKNEPTVDDDIICIDDEEDEEEKSSSRKSLETDGQSGAPAGIKDSESTPEKQCSYTEQLVNVLREKINQKIARDNLKKNKSSGITNENKLSKKRGKEDSIISAGPSAIEESQFRVTRSSLNPQQSRRGPSPERRQSSRTKSNGLSSMNEPMNKYSVENMFRGLVKICKKIFTDEALESKLWRTFRQASEEVLISEEFINALKIALKASEDSKIESLDDKLIVSREIKEVMRIMKRHPEVVDRKVKKLSKMLNIIRGRIRKLEEAEVTSDEEDENPYILLDRYRTRAAKIYDKLCELQGTPADAGRVVRQRFHFIGNSGYPKIEQALEKFYHKTNSFPDFFDVRTLVEKTVKKDNLDIPPQNIHNIAQTVFLEFGNKLKRMRCCDEYTILNDYLDEDKAKDPALDNEDLYQSLAKYDSSRKIRDAEQKILDEYTCKQLEQKSKEEAKSEESDTNEGSEDEAVLENKGEKEELCFSDTEEELMTTEVKDNKRKKSSSDEEDNEEDGTNLRKKADLEITDSTSPCKLKIDGFISLKETDSPR